MSGQVERRSGQDRRKIDRRVERKKTNPLLMAALMAGAVLLFSVGVYTWTVAHVQQSVALNYAVVRQQATKAISVLDGGHDMWAGLRPLLASPQVALHQEITAWQQHDAAIGYQPAGGDAYPAVFFQGQDQAIAQVFWLYNQATVQNGVQTIHPMMQVLLISYRLQNGVWLITSIETRLIAGVSPLPPGGPEYLQASK